MDGTIGHVAGLVYHKLAVVDFDYRANDFDRLGDMPLTTFVYEVPDHRRRETQSWNRIIKLFSGRVPKSIIRISRPCIITSRMSNFLQCALINVLYDTCLYEKRLDEKRYETSEYIFSKVKREHSAVLCTMQKYLT